MLAALAPQLSGQQLDEALAAARAIEGEGGRARVLAALAPQLSGQQLDEALAATRAIKHGGFRAQALVALRSKKDQKVHVREIRRCLVDLLSEQLSPQRREEVFQWISNMDVFRVPILGAETIAALARHIVEISHRWRWLL